MGFPGVSSDISASFVFVLFSTNHFLLSSSSSLCSDAVDVVPQWSEWSWTWRRGWTSLRSWPATCQTVDRAHTRYSSVPLTTNNLTLNQTAFTLIKVTLLSHFVKTVWTIQKLWDGLWSEHWCKSVLYFILTLLRCCSDYSKELKTAHLV